MGRAYAAAPVAVSVRHVAKRSMRSNLWSGLTLKAAFTRRTRVGYKASLFGPDRARKASVVAFAQNRKSIR